MYIYAYIYIYTVGARLLALLRHTAQLVTKQYRVGG